MKLVENAIVAGKFRLNRMLGGGGMGSVWHATHLGLDIPCAVKFVKGELLEQDDIKARFEREAKAAAQLRSPHVVQILDHGVCEGTPYIAMELLDGEDLGGRLERLGRLPVDQVCKIVGEACRALAKAHAQGIVHRDLKPDNIYIVRDDDREITKVLDFGIAKTISSEVGGSSTKTGAMLGTPYYMSPEQAQGTKAVDSRSDLWALAVIVFQCVTGRLPFESEALGDLLVKIIVAPIPFPSQYAPVPQGFDGWWARASARDPTERFQSAKAFSDSLALVCGVSQVSGVIDARQLGHETSASQGRAPQAAAVTGTTPTPLTRSHANGQSSVPADKTGLVVAVVLGAVLLGVVGGAGWFLVGRSHSSATSAATSSPNASAAAVPPFASAAPSASPPPGAPPIPAARPEDTSSATPSQPPSLPLAPTPPPWAGSSSHAKAVSGTTKPAAAPPPPAPPPPVSKTTKPSKQVDIGF